MRVNVYAWRQASAVEQRLLEVHADFVRVARSHGARILSPCPIQFLGALFESRRRPCAFRPGPSKRGNREGTAGVVPGSKG